MALDLGALAFNVELDTSNFTSSIAGVKRDLTAVKKNMEAVSGQKMDVAPTGGDKLDKADASAKNLKQSLSNVSSTKADVSPKGADGLDKADSSAKKLKDSLDGAESAAPDVTPKGADGLDRASQSSERLKDSLDKASQAGQTTRFPTQPGEEIDRTTEKAGRLSGVFGSMKGAIGFAGMTAAAGGVAFSFRSILEAGNELQNNMNILGAVSGASEQQLRAAGDAARELGTAADLPATSAGSAAAAMAELAKGGFSVEESMTAARGTLQLAAAAGIEAADAATIQSQAIQSFGLEAADAARVSDILAGAANASSAEIGGIAQGLAQSGAVAKQFGLSIEDTSTALAMFANAGIQGSDAGTLLKSALLALTDQGKPAQGAIEELGLSVYDMQGNFVGLPSMFGQLADAQKRMTPEAYQAATATLFGSDAMRLAGIAAEQGSEGFETLKGQVTEAGQAAKLAEDMTKGLPGAIGKIGNELEATGQKIYDKFAGPLEDSLLTATDRIGQFNEAILPDVMDGAAAVAGNFAGQISIIAGAAADTAGALSGILTPAIDGAKGAMDKAGIGDAIQSLGTPVVTGALVMLASNLTHLTDKVEAGAGKVKSFAGATKTSMGEIAQSFGTAYTSGSSHMRGLSDSYRLAAETARTQAMATSNSWDYADRATAQMARGFQANITQMGGVATGFTTGTLGAMKTGFGQLSGAAGGLVSALGGPWGIAIGVASTAVGILAQRHQEAKAAEEEHKAAQDELRGSLDTTTGAITAQTRELVAKKLEESGSAETARDLGLAMSDVVDAAMGNEASQRRVAEAMANSTQRALEGSEAWGKYGEHFTAAGLSSADVAAALDGNVDAIERVNAAIEATDDPSLAEGVGLSAELGQLRSDIEGTTEKFDEFGNAIIGANSDLAAVTAQQAQDELNALQRSVDQTREAMALLGENADVKIMSDSMINVAWSEESEMAYKKLEEMGLKVSEPMDGRVNIEFPDGLVISDVLNTIGAQLENLPGGRLQLEADDIDLALGALGLTREQVEMINGTTAIINTDSTDVGSAIQQMEQLGIVTRDPKTGVVEINDDAVTASDSRVAALQDRVRQGADGEARMSDNSLQVQSNIRGNLDNLTTYGKHVQTWEEHRITYWESRGQSARTQGPVPIANADGNIFNTVTAFANGGVTERHEAQIAPAGAWRVWAEEETGGEAYIPLAATKRSRSTGILAEVAQRFGYGLTPQVEAFADGGISETIKAGSRFMDGTPYIFGGWSRAGTDCSGAVAGAINTGLGLNFFDSRMATPNEGQWLAAKGFVEGRGDGNSVVAGWYNGGPGGGHTALGLPDGTFIESGGNTGGGFTIGRGAGPLDGRGFTNFMHLPDPSGATRAISGLNSANAASAAKTDPERPGGSPIKASARSTHKSTGKLDKEVNGGAGPLLRDGSVMELAAALFAINTGSDMPDDVTSWGNVMGRGTQMENAGKTLEESERNERRLDRDILGTERDLITAEGELEAAKAELRKGGFDKDEVAERQAIIDDGEDNIAELRDTLEDMREEQRLLRESNARLRNSIDRGPQSIIPMANGGILGNARGAQINEGSAVLWAEAGPEAYIPLASNKRAESTKIWAETGKRLGIDVMSMLNLIGSGLPGLMQGQVNVNTGGSVSLSALGLNMDAAAYRGGKQVETAVGAVFNGPVQINDPKNYLQGQVDVAGKQLGNALRSFML